MKEHNDDIAALQAGVHLRQTATSGLRLYTTDFDSISLANFFRGRRAFLVLTGPSLNSHDLTLLRKPGIVTMGVNNGWAVYRPTLWTCVDNPGRFFDTGWKDPGVVKFVPMAHWNTRLRIQKPGGELKPSAFRVQQMPAVFLYRRGEHFDHQTFLAEHTICWGNNSGTKDSLGIKGKRSVMMVALRLLHHLGIRTVYLIGADFKMDAEHKYAFGEQRTADAIRHNSVLYKSLDQRFEALRPHFKEHKFRVVNCTPDSGLTAFEHMPYEQAIEEATAECGKEVSPEGWYT